MLNYQTSELIERISDKIDAFTLYVCFHVGLFIRAIKREPEIDLFVKH